MSLKRLLGDKAQGWVKDLNDLSSPPTGADKVTEVILRTECGAPRGECGAPRGEERLSRLGKEEKLGSGDCLHRALIQTCELQVLLLTLWITFSIAD